MMDPGTTGNRQRRAGKRWAATKPVVVSVAGQETPLAAFRLPLDLARLVPGEGPWEVELGFGKGRYLLKQALGRPEARFLGVELAAYYYQLLARRAARQGANNLVAVRGDALYVMAALLPKGFADAVHVYFPDPWPKNRHHKRRLFEPETIDLVLGLLKPGASLWFATDFLEYGELVWRILDSYPGLEARRIEGPWPGGPRTNYEAKFVEEGRPIVRFEARKSRRTALFHPAGQGGILVAPRPWAASERPGG